MSNTSEAISAGKLSAISIASSLGSIPLEDTTQVGQIIAIIVSIISGISSLVKMFKKKS
jgi:hypothetical protein